MSRKPIPTPQIENYQALARAAILRAVDDLHSPNPRTRADARVWLWDVGVSWLEVLHDTNPQGIREQILTI